jgi:hypothetical protein
MPVNQADGIPFPIAEGTRSLGCVIIRASAVAALHDAGHSTAASDSGMG